MMETRISSKGQITIPLEARKKLGIKTGDVLEVRVTDEGILVFTGRAGAKKDPAKSIEILHKTSGTWRNMEQSGEDFVSQLRNQDNERWKVLGLE